MSPDTNITMGEALRLTRAGRLTEATAVLQRGLASPGTATAGESSAAYRCGDLLGFGLPDSSDRSRGWPHGPRANAASAPRRLEDLPAKLPGLPDIASSAGRPGRPGRPGRVRSSSGGVLRRAAGAPGGEVHHLTHTESAGTRRYDLYV